MGTINAPSDLSCEYIGVWPVRIVIENGKFKSLDLIDDLTIELDSLGNVIARPFKVTPVVAVIGDQAWAMAPPPAGQVY